MLLKQKNKLKQYKQNFIKQKMIKQSLQIL